MALEDSGFWKDRKVFVTGHTGFKGTWFSLMLELLGACVCGYALPAEENSLFQKTSPRLKMHMEDDVRDKEQLWKVFTEFEPEIVIHLGSHSSLEGSREIPADILSANLLGPINLFECIRQTNFVKSVVIVTSDKCYYNQNRDVAYKEEEPLWASDPYSASKVGQELITECYMSTFFSENPNIGIATARASNVIGPGDYNYSRLFPYIFSKFAEGRKPHIRNPKAVRPWQYVLDVLNGYLILAEKLYNHSQYNGAYNFGPDPEGFLDVETVTRYTASAFGNLPYIIEAGSDRIKKEANILKLDSSKAAELLGWTPMVTVKDAIIKSVDFVKEEFRGTDVSDLARKFVSSYFKENIRMLD